MNGWLSPSGKFFKCGLSKHIEKAKELFLAENSEYALERLGWIKICENFIFSSASNDAVEADKLTQAQVNWLWEKIESKDVGWVFREAVADILRERT